MTVTAMRLATAMRPGAETSMSTPPDLGYVLHTSALMIRFPLLTRKRIAVTGRKAMTRASTIGRASTRVHLILQGAFIHDANTNYSGFPRSARDGQASFSSAPVYRAGGQASAIPTAAKMA